GLNYRDVLAALDLYPGDPGPLGNECAGTVVEVGPGVEGLAVGEDVLAIAPASFATFATTSAEFVARKPPSLSFAPAAAAPIAYLTATHGLLDLARLSAGERVLVHAAAGGVGLAAVEVARRAGAEVFATASRAKHEFLRSRGVRHVFDSRTLDFAGEVMDRTDGKGVHVVMNSLSGDAIEKSLSVLAPGGRFLEIGKRGIWDASRVARFREDVRYMPFDLAELVRRDPARVRAMLERLARELEDGSLPPLPVRLFALEDATHAFRFMAEARHVGKIVLVQPPDPENLLRPDATYLVTGGLGALGLAVARWMVERGARNILLLSRSEPAGAAHETIESLKERAARVELLRADVTREGELDLALSRIAKTMPPLAGAVHAAGVLDDGVLAELTWERLEKVLAPKVWGAASLAHALREAPLEFLVFFSSAASVLCPAGQGSYAAANAFLDAFARELRATGIPATSVAWGPWKDLGMARSASEADRARWHREGVTPLEPEEALALLERAIRQGSPSVLALKGDPNRFARTVPPPAVFAPGAGNEPDLVKRLREAPSPERRAILVEHLARLARGILALDPSRPLDPTRPLRELGLDSLMAVELRNAAGSTLALDLPTTLAFDHPTIDAIAGHVLEAYLGLALPSPRAPALSAARDSDDPIAVVGLGCRFPGGASDPESFWRLLAEGRDAITEVPPDRWDAGAYYDPQGGPGKMVTRWGGFLSGVDRFDPHFFGIAPKEAASMDPQHRLLLEVAWEALEHAGQPPDRLAGSATGVFVGACWNDYASLFSDLSRIDAYMPTGNALSIAAGRLSYVLGFSGPAIAVDTSCSSSLVAVHLACQSLHSGECRMALAGGVNLILFPTLTVALSALRMMSPDGRCKAFDARANGFVRGEGCGVVVLKRLSNALADGDRVLALVLGTAVNQDGRSSGLTAPNGPAQEAVIRRALEVAGALPAEVGYVEAHGTGTELGDPIEARALGAVLGAGRDREARLLVGSVKTNLGHLEAAAGVAGFIKTVLALQHDEIPPSLHFETPSPHIEWDRLPIEVPTRPRPWPAHARRRTAGVSSFGFSGTNAHAILSAAPAVPGGEPLERPPYVLPLSAQTDTALAELAGRYAHFIEERPAVRFADICFTAGAGRKHFERRLAIVAGTADEAREKLARWLAGERRPELQGEASDLAELYEKGEEIDWVAIYRELAPRKVELPTYPFQRSRYWVAGSHPLVSRRVDTARGEILFEGRLSGARPALLADHRIHGRVVLPGAGHLSMALWAARQVVGARASEILDVSFLEALVIPEGGARQIELALAPGGAGEATFEIHGRAEPGDGDWTLHSRGRIGPAEAEPAPEPVLSWAEGPGEDPESFHAAMWEAGYHLERGFRWIERIWRGENEAVARLREPADDDEWEAWLVHPGFLDSCFQLLAAALPEGEQLGTAYMPIGLERLAFHGFGRGRYWCRARLVSGSGTHETVTGEFTVADEAGRVALRVSGLVAKRATPEALARLAGERAPDWLYEVEWREKPLTPVEASSPFESRTRSMAASIAARPEIGAYREFLPALERVARTRARDALERLGAHPERTVPEKHRRLLARVIELAAEAGETLSVEALAEAYPFARAEIDLFARSAEALPDVLAGRKEGLAALFPNGSAELVERVYRDSPVTRATNELAREAVRAAVEGMPAGRKIRTLEVGAGTGATTAAVLAALPASSSEYVFTDVSGLFLARARERFREHPAVRTATLDIERPPGEQGFAGERFDLVVAANVLHATADLAESLSHVRELLAPGGTFVLVEGTERQGWVDLVFGLTEGWWRFRDGDLRRDHPLLSGSAWLDLLARSGFEGALSLGPEGAPGGQRVFVARAPAEREAGTWLLVGGSGGEELPPGRQDGAGGGRGGEAPSGRSGGQDGRSDDRRGARVVARGPSRRSRSP
ncbi:MAG: SDR family NAD(P)-dependent oxidoreductase, partial [Planctomycetes bacterium]|nr:SDR family NAD(P)-dependent oxidoreductase [Planctomycetota bacterium]